MAQPQFCTVGILALSIIFFSCDPKKDSLLTGDINPDFEQSPPIASEVFLQRLEKEDANGNNVKVMARFSKDAIKGDRHAVTVNDEKLILRDDGQGADSIKGDGIFSIFLKEDLSSLQTQITQIGQKFREGFTQDNMFRFVNRSAQRDTTLKSVQLNRFDVSQRIRLNDHLIFLFSDRRLRDHSLMITETSVVEDPTRTFNPCTEVGTANGAWTFERLMRELVNTASTTITVEDFTRNWLEQWMNNQTINGETVTARSTILTQIIIPWLTKSGATAPVTPANWKTKPILLKFAPFKLLAIVNRLDLRGNSGYGFSNAGEGRFVFGGLNPTCGPVPLTVIFEYGINKRKCADQKAFALQWYNLKNMGFGAAFNTALQAITDQFTLAGTNASKPNGSSLNQLRTNEIFLGRPWELREFTISGASHFLLGTTVKQEPSEIFNRLGRPATTVANRTKLAEWVNANTPAILNARHSVPNTLSTGENFLGGRAHTETLGHFWDANEIGSTGRITNDNARHVFSLNTCSGCHGGEGKTPAFTHIAPSAFGAAATLSGFLTGLGPDADATDDDGNVNGFFFVRDPAGRPMPSPTIRGFNDLKRRSDDLEQFISINCRSRVLGLFEVLTFKPLNMTH